MHSANAKSTDEGCNSTARKAPTYPPPLIITPLSTHTSTLILLHGRGSSGPNFGAELLKASTSQIYDCQTSPSLFPNTKFIFPTAKKRRARAFNQAVINQWFDIWEIGDEDTEEREQVQVEGLRETGEFIRGLVEEEGRLVGSENVVLGGLTQGCAAALHLLLGLESQGKEGKQLLGGFVGMSGWLPFRGRLETILDSEADGEDDPFAGDDVEDEDVEIQPTHFVGDVMDLSPNFSSLPSLCTPVFMGHGKADEKVDMELGENAARILRRMGLDLIWREYDVGHWYMVPDEIDDVVTFLRESVGI